MPREKRIYSVMHAHKKIAFESSSVATFKSNNLSLKRSHCVIKRTYNTYSVRSSHVRIKVNFFATNTFGVCLLQSEGGRGFSVAISLYYHLSVPKYSFDRDRK